MERSLLFPSCERPTELHPHTSHFPFLEFAPRITWDMVIFLISIKFSLDILSAFFVISLDFILVSVFCFINSRSYRNQKHSKGYFAGFRVKRVEVNTRNKARGRGSLVPPWCALRKVKDPRSRLMLAFLFFD